MADLTTEEVREAAATDGVVHRVARAAFDRWLAQHDRQVAAKALRDAAGRIEDMDMDGWEYRTAAHLNDHADDAEEVR